MFLSALLYYYVFKVMLFFSLVRIQVRFETMKEHWLFLAGIYTAGVALLSYVFLFSWQKFPWADWQLQAARTAGTTPEIAFLGETLLLSTLYFWLLSRFDEGVIFWTLLLLGLLVVRF